MCNMFKAHILVTEALSRNPDEYREICAHCVRRGERTTNPTSVHAPFCIGVNGSSDHSLCNFSSELQLAYPR